MHGPDPVFRNQSNESYQPGPLAPSSRRGAHKRASDTMNRRVAARDRALRRLRNTTRMVTAAAVAGAGLLALLAGRTAPGHRAVRLASATPSEGAAPAPAAIIPPAGTVAPLTVPAAPRRSGDSERSATSTPTRSHRVLRGVAPAPATTHPVVTSGAS